MLELFRESDGSIKPNLLRGLFLVVATLLAAAYLTWPYGWDQGIYVWMAQEIRAGGVPYSDVWDVKGPGAIYLVAIAQIVFGDSPVALRAFDLTVFGIGVAMTYRLTMMFFGCRHSARLSAALLVLWYLTLRYWHTAQPDGWGTWMLVGATLLVMTSNKAFSILAAGALVGAASMIKPQFVLFAIPMLLLARTGPAGVRMKRLWGLGIVGAILPVIGTAALLWKNGALDEAIESYLVYGPSVYASAAGSLAEIARHGIDWLFGVTTPAALFPLAMVGWFALKRRDRARAMAVAIWILGTLALIVLQRWFFGYHIMPAMPWICLLGGHGIVTLLRLWQESPPDSSRRNTFAAVSLALLLSLTVHIGVFAGYDVLRSWAYLTGNLSKEVYLDGMGKPGNDYRLSRYLASDTDQSDKILLWGMNTTALALSHRQAWGRFGFNMPLTIDQSHPISLRWRAEFRAAFAHSQPDFLVFGEGHTAAPNLEDDPLTCALRALANEEYIHRFSAGPLEVFERRDSGDQNLRPLAEHPCPTATFDRQFDQQAFMRYRPPVYPSS